MSMLMVPFPTDGGDHKRTGSECDRARSPGHLAWPIEPGVGSVHGQELLRPALHHCHDCQACHPEHPFFASPIGLIMDSSMFCARRLRMCAASTRRHSDGWTRG